MPRDRRSSKLLDNSLRGGFLVIGAIIAGIVGATASRHLGTSAYTISFADFVAILLSAVTLLMTLLGFILAVLAYVGWRELNERIDNKVVGRATEFLEEGFREDGPLHKMFHVNAKRASYSGVDPILDNEDDDGEQ